MISALTGGQAPIIVDDVVKELELELISGHRISQKAGHYRSRSECVDSFATILDLKTGPNSLQPSANTTADIINSIDSASVSRHVVLAEKFATLVRSDQLDQYRELMRAAVTRIPQEMGLKYTMVNIPHCFAC